MTAGASWIEGLGASVTPGAESGNAGGGQGLASCPEPEPAARMSAWERDDIARREAENAARLQDTDFHAFGISIAFDAQWADGTLEFESEWDIADWETVPSDARGDGDRSTENAGRNEGYSRLVHAQIAAALEPWLDHFRSAGLLRADGLRPRLIGKPAVVGSEPTFYLICEADCAALDPLTLGHFDATISIDALPGVEVAVRGYSFPVNATRLFDALPDCLAPIGLVQGEATPDLMPVPGEDRRAWLERVALDPATLTRFMERWEASGRDITLFASYGALATRSDRPIDYVAGFWPRGYVSLVVGTNSAGKSTAMHEWVAAAGGMEVGRPRRVWGCDITGRIVAALVSGEDGEDVISVRAEMFAPLWGAPQYFAIDAHDLTIEQVIEKLGRAPVLDLVVIDPVRLFLEGNEDGSDSVSAFYRIVTAFARQKGCAVILVHHLTKGGPGPLQHMLPRVRGSGVHTDRARLVVGITKNQHDVATIGILKCNLPPDEPIYRVLGLVGEGRRFRRDPQTLTHVPIDGAAPLDKAGEDDTLQRVASVLLPLLEAGAEVYQTGDKSLYKRSMPSLAGIGRDKMADAIKALIAAGGLIDNGEGLKLPPAKSP